MEQMKINCVICKKTYIEKDKMNMESIELDIFLPICPDCASALVKLTKKESIKKQISQMPMHTWN